MNLSKFITQEEDTSVFSHGQFEHVTVTYDDDGRIVALRWRFETSDNGLYDMAKRRGGSWDKAAGGWTFQDPKTAKTLLEAIQARHPDWPVIDTARPLGGLHASRFEVGSGYEACLIPLPVPREAYIPHQNCRVFRIATTNDAKKGAIPAEQAVLLIGGTNDIIPIVTELTEQGVVWDDSLKKKWRFRTGSKLKVTVTGWAVQIECDVENPLHYLTAPEQTYHWEGAYPYGVRVANSWKGTIHTTRRGWAAQQAAFAKVGIDWEGDDPDAELTVPTSFNTSQVAGWETSAPNGHLLHAYQKEGAMFCASRGMRALIGDEMGVGKTAQAIAAAEGVDAKRIVVICPANARYVWEREIQGWSGCGTIQHITNQLEKLDTNARWHIVTYDLITTRAETWRLKDAQEKKAFLKTFPDIEIEEDPEGSYPIKVKLDDSIAWYDHKPPPFADSKRIAAWDKVMQRLRGELLNQILSAGQMLVILDEAHRVKNRDAKRTQAIQRIAAGESQLLMLTGTPLRNHEHEAAVLLGILNAEAASALSKRRGYTIQDIKDFLGHYMIRRTKQEVLPELPEKTRQRIDIANLDAEAMQAYRDAMNWAQEVYVSAITNGASEKEARQRMQGGIEKARTALGCAKIRGGEVASIVLDVVENTGCCVVFCAHHDVSDELKKQLDKANQRVAVIDGDTPQKIRAGLVTDFQEKRLDVLIGGINAAGEAITLTRSDTVVFVELDWVPAALLQAEDRIHRVGQKNTCQIIQVIARMAEGEENLDEGMIDLIGAKIARIAEILNEDPANIVAQKADIRNELYDRLIKRIPPDKMQTASKGPVAKDANQAKSVVPLPPPDRQDTSVVVETEAENAQEPVVSEPAVPEPLATTQTETITKPEPVSKPEPKRRRGRPRVYTDKAPPTATERSKNSVKELAAAGGKRLMLRLTPEAYEALKAIMAVTGTTQETATINQVILFWRGELQRMLTKI